jgi:hypothetical protein
MFLKNVDTLAFFLPLDYMADYMNITTALQT